uniref:RING-type E3 ubiquitin transferase n=1 Tax=Leersia perrieri TaxID=77586 RepID=A0A0D9WTM3_9ORYZ
MEENSSRSTSTTGFLRRSSSVSKNQGNDERPNKTKLNPMKARWADNKEKPRYLREPFRSSGTKTACPSSSKTPIRKYYEEKQGRSFLAEVDNAESSNRRTEVNRLQSSNKAVVEKDMHPYGQQAKSEDLLSTLTSEDQPELNPELSDSSTSSVMPARAFGSAVRNTALRPKSRQHKGKEELCQIRPQSASAFVNRSTISRNSTNGVRPSNSAGPGVQRRSLKNLGCTSISDVLPSGCSSSNAVHNRRTEVIRNMTFDAESSSGSRGLSAQSSLGHSPAMYSGITGPRFRAAEQSASQQSTRPSSRSILESADSARTRRPSTQHTRVRIPNEREDSVFALRETVTRVQQPEWARFSLDEAPQQRSMRPFSMEFPHEIYSSSRQGSNNQTARRRSTYRTEESPADMFHGLLVERDAYRRINMEGITEVLLALDRIEQDDELSYEQLLVLETNLFLSGLGLHDQHRDLRMDIDNMSYEELLALEERIGSVSTALSDEQLVKCLNRSVYKLPNSDLEVHKAVVDDIKCSICQEEYIEGEEVGRMQCEHQYHVSCIHEWLKQKNWCPVCKTSAIPSEMDKEGT